MDGSRAQQATPWARSLARWQFLAGAMRFVCYLLTALVVVAVLMALWVWNLFLIDGELPTGVWTPLAVTVTICESARTDGRHAGLVAAAKLDQRASSEPYGT